MTFEALNIDSTGDVARFHADMPRRWEKTGAAIVLIDHVVKAKDQRGSYAIGSQHKRAGVNGVHAVDEAERNVVERRDIPIAPHL